MFTLNFELTVFYYLVVIETALGGSSSNEEEEEYRPKEVSTATGQDLPPSTAVVGKK